MIIIFSNFEKMKSKPGFTIDIKRGGKTLSFECEYLESEGKDAPGIFI